MDCKDTNNSQNHKFFRSKNLAFFSRDMAEEFLVAFAEVRRCAKAHGIGDLRYGFVRGFEQLFRRFQARNAHQLNGGSSR